MQIVPPDTYKVGTLARPQVLANSGKAELVNRWPEARRRVSSQTRHMCHLPQASAAHPAGWGPIGTSTAALQLADSTPVIGLTLRYDRLDNFWFCLLHELAHI